MSSYIGILWGQKRVYRRALETTLTIACSAGVFFGCANVLLAKAHVETRKGGRKWWLQQYEHKQAAFARPKHACTAGYSHKYDIPLPPTLSPSMLAGPENMEGRSPCRENKDSLPIQIPRCDTPLGNLRRKNSCKQGIFSGEKQNFVYHKDFGLWRVT